MENFMDNHRPRILLYIFILYVIYAYAWQVIWAPELSLSILHSKPTNLFVIMQIKNENTGEHEEGEGLKSIPEIDDEWIHCTPWIICTTSAVKHVLCFCNWN